MCRRSGACVWPVEPDFVILNDTSLSGRLACRLDHSGQKNKKRGECFGSFDSNSVPNGHSSIVEIEILAF